MHMGTPAGRLTTNPTKLEQWVRPGEHKQGIINLKKFVDELSPLQCHISQNSRAIKARKRRNPHFEACFSYISSTISIKLTIPSLSRKQFHDQTTTSECSVLATDLTPAAPLRARARAATASFPTDTPAPVTQLAKLSHPA